MIRSLPPECEAGSRIRWSAIHEILVAENPTKPEQPDVFTGAD